MSLGPILLRSRLLPSAFGFLALGLGVAFEVAGLVGPYTTSLFTILVLSLQALWVLAASLIWLLRSGKPLESAEQAV